MRRCNVTINSTLHTVHMTITDVPDIQFRLAGYPAIFSNPVPAPVPAKMVPGTRYLSRIVLGPFRAFRASLQHCRRSH